MSIGEDLQLQQPRANQRVALRLESLLERHKLEAKLGLDLVVHKEHAWLCGRPVCAACWQRSLWIKLTQVLNYVEPRLCHAAAQVTLSSRHTHLRSAHVRSRHVSNVHETDGARHHLGTGSGRVV